MLHLSDNNITTLPASIGNLAGTCTDFRIDGNPLGKSLEEAANGVFQGMKQYVESKKIIEEAARVIRGDDNDDDEVTEIIDLTSIQDDDAVIDVDTFIIDFLGPTSAL